MVSQPKIFILSHKLWRPEIRKIKAYGLKPSSRDQQSWLEKQPYSKNVGFAPLNINQQSWVNVNTKVDIDIDVNLDSILTNEIIDWNLERPNDVQTSAEQEKENIASITENLDFILADIDLLDQNILQLLEYWDKNGLLKHDGTFNKPTRTKILEALSKVQLATLFDNWEITQLHQILKNADEWLQYYNCTRTIVSHIYKSSINPTASENDIASHLQANWEHVYSAPKHITNLIESKLMTKVGINAKTETETFLSKLDRNGPANRRSNLLNKTGLKLILAKDGFSLENFAVKVQLASNQSAVDFEKLLFAVTNSDPYDYSHLKPYIEFALFYIDFLMDEKEPQFPGFLWGLFSCLSTDEINNFNNAAGGNVRETWTLGVQELYADDENFNACMIPFNGLWIDYRF